tara:strand:+ start:1837 stop:1968 length:132 start_codon:yes stop_codon:yes gene_type:complete
MCSRKELRRISTQDLDYEIQIKKNKIKLLIKYLLEKYMRDISD